MSAPNGSPSNVIPLPLSPRGASARGGRCMDDDDESTDVINRYLRYLELLGRRPGTIRLRRNSLRRLARALPVPLLQASRADLLAWRGGLTTGDDATCGDVSCARSFYGWAEAEELIAVSPAVRIPVPGKPRHLPRPIDADSLWRATEAAAGRMRLWLLLAALAGLRCCEISALRAEDIRLTAPAPYLMVRGKGGRERVVELHPLLAAELRSAGLPARGWCFPRRDGRPGPNQPWHVSRLIADHLRSHGIEATAHMLRHFFGTEALEASGDVRAVQELLGHASLATTQVYTLVRSPRRAAAIAGLPVPRRLRAVLPPGGHMTTDPLRRPAGTAVGRAVPGQVVRLAAPPFPHPAWLRGSGMAPPHSLATGPQEGT